MLHKFSDEIAESKELVSVMVTCTVTLGAIWVSGRQKKSPTVTAYSKTFNSIIQNSRCVRWDYTPISETQNK
jgi:hypothetical protein